MYPAERQREIVRIAQQNEGSVAVGSLADALSVAPETVRRDLAVLERQGVIARRHGGASLVGPVPFEASLARRNQEERAEKERIVQRIIELLPEDGVVLLDSGSLAYLIAEAFPDREQTVVTNNIAALPILRRRTRLTVLALPGRLRPVTQAAVDTWTARRLADLHVDVAVLGANGVTVDAGATTTTPEEAQVKAAMLRTGRRRVLAVTASKLGLTSFCRFADLSDFDAIVTDDRVPDDDAAAISAAGPELVVV